MASLSPATPMKPQFRSRTSFQTRAAEDTAAQLDRRASMYDNLRDPQSTRPVPVPRKSSLRTTDRFDGVQEDAGPAGWSSLKRIFSGSHGKIRLGDDGPNTCKRQHPKSPGPASEYKPPRPSKGTPRLGTFTGAFVPVSLNVLSILMFLRFGFILGQSGFLGMMGMLLACYALNLLTTLSISAIATNGTVRGGGAYYLISRSLGPEFGGAIGVVFYLGLVFNTGLNAIGLVDCLLEDFGSKNGNWSKWLPESFWWQFCWGTIVLVLCTCICLAGSGIFARCSNGLLAILLIAVFSIPISALFVEPFRSPELGIDYRGINPGTFLGNLWPHFTKGADGSQIKGRENIQDLFSILYPATAGIFAGASMSGDLKHPSKAIPKGTLYGLLLTFVAYTLVILALAFTVTRDSLYRNSNMIQEVNSSGVVILLGEFAASFFSALMGVIGAAKLLQALARDEIIPGLSVFGQGTKANDEPVYAILITYILSQLTMLSNINQIASLVTMAYLMTFLVTNLACFLLKISSAPNFRPSFQYFNWVTAFLGTILSAATMFFVDGVYASASAIVVIIIFLLIHYTSPPKSWGDVSQSLIYHQVRKYLLRLRQEHVKFWRPQILLLVNDPRRSYKLIQFCNSLKKGALYVLGHVIVTDDFASAVPESRRQHNAWTKYIDFSRIKAFVNVTVSPAIEWGTRNLVLSAGLGGMRPNIVVLGFYNLDELRKTQPLINVPAPQQSHPVTPKKSTVATVREATHTRHAKSVADKLRGNLPTDWNRSEGAVGVQSYLTIVEDLLLRLRVNVAVAKGFQELEIPASKPTRIERLQTLVGLKQSEKPHNDKKYIDLWPIQMSAEIATEGEDAQSVLTTNFDTYTLILQLGCILNTVPSWKSTYSLRVIVFVEYESDIEEERGRVKSLLNKLRIVAEVLVFALASGELSSYEVIVNGVAAASDAESYVDDALSSEEWWQEIKRSRGRGDVSSPADQLAAFEGLSRRRISSPGRHSGVAEQIDHLRNILSRSRKRRARSHISQIGVGLGMQTQRLAPDIIETHRNRDSASEDSDSDSSDGVLESASEETSSRPRRGVLADSPRKRTLGRDNAQQRRGHEHSQTALDVHQRSSTPKLTSDPTPEIKIAAEEGNKRSIMFSSDSETSPGENRISTPTERQNDDGPSSVAKGRISPASGYPFPQSVSVSFNDLPCRAQHLILNELMARESGETAVVFTTLPSPAEGTSESMEDSVRYLSDLEMLCLGLPPVLLVHSNSMTVTMSL
ncbi:MAG: hypothetical protein M1821_006549 [Bathelium mastoideum]|nr:MAG: hypothetical protein M1821_006549 [Bathelium mastoideum]